MAPTAYTPFPFTLLGGDNEVQPGVELFTTEVEQYASVDEAMDALGKRASALSALVISLEEEARQIQYRRQRVCDLMCRIAATRDELAKSL